MKPTKPVSSMREAVERERKKAVERSLPSMREAVERSRVKTNTDANNKDYERRFARLSRARDNFPFCMCNKDDPTRCYDIPEGNYLPSDYKVVCIDFGTRTIHSKDTDYFKNIEKYFNVGAMCTYESRGKQQFKIKVLSEDGTVPNGYRLFIYPRETIS